MNDGTFRKWLFGITLVAGLLRLGVSIELLNGYPAVASPSEATDMYTYQSSAFEVMDGTFSYSEGFYYQPFYYTAFLPAVYALSGRSVWGVIIVQSLVGAATVLLVGLIFLRCFDPFSALVGAGLIALSRFHIFYTPFTLIAVLQGFWLTLTLWLALKAADGRPPWFWLWPGLVLGISITTRGNMWLFLPLVLVLQWAVLRTVPRLKLAAAAACLVGAVILAQLPYAIVNHAATGAWIGASSAAGPVMLLGNTPDAPPGGREAYMGAGPMEYPQVWHEWSALSNRTDEGRVSAPASIMAWFRQEPLAVVELQWRKLLLFWNKAEPPNNVAISARGVGVPSRLLHLPLLFGFAVLGSLALAGMLYATAMRWRDPRVLFLVGAGVIYCVSIVMFYILSRFRLPVLPLYCGFGGVCVGAIVKYGKAWRKEGQNRPIVRMVLLLCVSVVIVGWGYDLYRTGYEAAVMRVVRADGVQLDLMDGRYIHDHGPQFFGSWTPLSDGHVLSVKKRFVIRPAPASIGSVKLRFAVFIEKAGIYSFSCSDRAGSALGLRSVELQGGLAWVDVPLSIGDDQWKEPDAELEVVIVIEPISDVGAKAGGPLPIFVVDTQRDYGRTEISSGAEARYNRAPGELVAELVIGRAEEDAK